MTQGIKALAESMIATSAGKRNDIYYMLKDIVDNLNRYLHENDLSGHEEFEKIRNRLGRKEFVCELRKKYWDPIVEIRNKVEALKEEEEIDV